MKMIASLLIFAFAWTVLAQAPAALPASAAAVKVVIPASVSPAPLAPVVAASVAVAAAPADAVPVEATGILAWIAKHIGSQSAILVLMGAAMSILSGIRQILAFYDGVAPGAAIPAGMVGLSAVNKICLILGKVVDFLTGNIAH